MTKKVDVVLSFPAVYATRHDGILNAAEKCGNNPLSTRSSTHRTVKTDIRLLSQDWMQLI
jgi:hypothetical protein